MKPLISLSGNQLSLNQYFNLGEKKGNQDKTNMDLLNSNYVPGIGVVI